MEYRSKRSVSSREIPPFYMSAYVMGAILFSSSFPTMGWKWMTQDPTPIHIYQRALWESDFHLHFYKIFHRVILPMPWLYSMRNPLGFPKRLIHTFFLLPDGFLKKFSPMLEFSQVNIHLWLLQIYNASKNIDVNLARKT